MLGALQAELASRDGDIAGARAAVDDALDRIEFCSDDALRMAMVSAAGLAAEATAAQHARDLGDSAAVEAALAQAELLVARVRACAEDGGPPEQAYLAHAEADHCRAVGSDQARALGRGGRRVGRARAPLPGRARALAQRRGARGGRRPRGRRRRRERGDGDGGAARRGLAGGRDREPRGPRAAAAWGVADGAAPGSDDDESTIRSG